MKYPAIGKMQSRAVSVPALTGGVNLLDPLSLVDDNQLTDMKNLWYQNGALRTRPAVRAGQTFDEGGAVMGVTEVYSTNLSQFMDGEKYTLLVKKTGEGVSKEGTIEVIAVGAAGRLFSSSTYFSVMPESEVFYAGQPTLENGTGIYMLATVADGEVELYEMTETGDTRTLTKLTGDDLYQPTVYINGKMDSFTSISTAEDAEYAPASFFEGYSAFSDAWNVFTYTSDGASYLLTPPVKLSEAKAFYFEYTDPDDGEKYTFGPVEHTVTNDVTLDVPCNEKPEYYAVFQFKLNWIGIWTTDSASIDQRILIKSALGIMANNVVIKLKFKVTDSMLSGMRIATWFGGSAEGISGGTRLFLAGSEDKKNLLCWSDVNNPTYFSENNYAYIGEASQRITALAKQSEMLVIFKENELFYTAYTQGDTISANDVINGAVVDVSASAAVFPMIQIHSEIGCDIPESIQLCGDRLVWACRDRHVYMLRSANQYSTCNISPISSMCDRALAAVTEAELGRVRSCIYNGHYLLAFGGKVFVLNYDYYYFKNLPAYSDSKRSQRKLIWYLWEIPDDPAELFSVFLSSGDTCSIVAAYAYYPESGGAQYTEYRLYELTEEIDEDRYLKLMQYQMDTEFFASLELQSAPIQSMLQTKLFDFGMMERFKKIEQIYIGFGETAGEVRMTYVTEGGRKEHGVFFLHGTGDDYAPEYIQMKRFLPGVTRALKFGVRLECAGRVAVDGILIKYKPMGVTR